MTYNTTIAWPAIIHFSGDNELIFIANQAEWDADSDLNTARYVSSDRLIDSQGTIFSLSDRIINSVTLQQSGQTACLTEVVELVKAHLSEQGSCCVSKFSAASIAQAIDTAFPAKR